MKTLRQDKRVRTFVWTLVNALITLVISFATATPYAVLLIPILNELTKYININFFNDLGVE